MNNYKHKKLLEVITTLDKVPTDSRAFSEWISAKAHLEFLQENAQEDELVIYASSEFTYIHSVVVPNINLSPINQDDLMSWSINPYTPIASYVMGGGRSDVWVERGLGRAGTKAFDGATQLIFGRTFEGWTGTGRNFYELNQEYAHLSEIYWRPEKKAYCRFNENGDLEPVVTITTREDKVKNNLSLVSFQWKQLEEYLVATQSSLIRMFDFTLVRHSEFNGWSNELPKNLYDSSDFFYHQMVMPGHAAYTRGVQIIHPHRPEKEVFTDMKNGWFGQKDKKYVEFTAYDWRHGQIKNISTDPSTTANYFNAKENSLPFELSPAFFRPEVLLKYKADREKYTVGERDISCRASWYLKGIDINKAGQVHAYICDLRHLPYNEQLHWLSFNEPPKTGISERAFINDFKGEWVNFMEPLQKVKFIIRKWHDDNVAWWILRDERLIDNVNTPLTESRDEWAEAFMDLAKLVIEGFEVQPIYKKLENEKISYGKDDKSITLLEKLLNKNNSMQGNSKLTGLRSVQLLRSKVKGHVSGSEAEQLAHNALMEHETFGNHFRHICTQIINDLETIENLFSR